MPSQPNARADLALPRYFGIFSALSNLGITVGTPDGADLYGPSFAEFYQQFVGQTVADIPLYARLVSPGGRVLDLACGTGRIGISLARQGFIVDGIDLSEDMLALANRALEGEPPEVAARCHMWRQDITAFEIPHRYDLILLGATSLSLILASEAREAMFSKIAQHLNPGGQFAFDLLNLTGERWRLLDNYQDVWSTETDLGQEFAIVGQRFFPEDRTFTFNVYREVIEWNGSTKRYLGSSTKAWLEAEELLGALRRAGLELLSTSEANGCLFYVTRKGGR